MENNTSENKYIQSIILNGKELSRSHILHSEIMAGGELKFKMGGTPNKNFLNLNKAEALSSEMYQ